MDELTRAVMARVTSDSVPDGDLGREASGILGRPLRRRAFLQVAGLSALGVMGARAGLAGIGPAADDPAEPPGARHADPIGELAASLEHDVDRIFRFVADEVRYEPYPGILRGARGTLTARAGNSADQALLLAALLEASLVPVRFVHGAIDEAQAALLLGGAVVDQPTAQADAERLLLGTAGTDPPAATELPEPDPELREVLDLLPEIAASAREVAGRQLEAGIRTVVDALAGAGIDLPMMTSEVPALERERHVWVQMAAAAEWIDLDPTAPDARAGATLTEPAGEPLDVLPDDLRHHIGFEVIVERLMGDALIQESVMEHAAFADELAGVPIVLMHERPQALEGLGVGLAGVLAGTNVYQPILQVGDLALVGLSSLSFGGDGGPLGGLGGLGELDGSPTTEGEATAEWLEVHLTPPLGERSTTRRTLFDRVGEAQRASGRIDASAIEPAELVDLDETLRSEYPPLRTLHMLAVAGGPSTGDLIRDAEGDETGLTLLQRGAHLFHLFRDAMAIDLGSGHGVRAFLDGPNVTAWSLATASPAGDAQDLTAGVDVLARSFGQLPLVGGRVDVPPGVLSGVLSHVSERVAMGEGLPVEVEAGTGHVSVGAVFEAAQAQGLDVLVLQGHVPDDLPFPPRALDRLRRAVGEGWVAIVPERPVALGQAERLGWWLVEPRTGRTIDELDDGSGGVIADYVIPLAKIALQNRRAIARLGVCLLNFYLQASTLIDMALDIPSFIYGMVLSMLTNWFFRRVCG